MASSRKKNNDYEKTTGGEEHSYEQIETAHVNMKKEPVFNIETTNGNVKKATVLILSLRRWLIFVLLPLLIVSLLSISLILTVAYFSLYADIEAKMEKKYAFLMTKQNLSATEFHAKVNEARADIEAKMEKKYAFLMTKQNLSATEIHAKVNEARAELEMKMEKKYEFLIAEQNISSTEIRALANEPRVAVTACVSSSQRFSDRVIRFSTVNFQVGINNINTFKSSGKFVCEIPGLYYLSAHIYTNIHSTAFHVMMNNAQIAHSTCDSGTSSSDSVDPISAVVELQLEDTLYVFASHYIYGTYSCVSIMKVK